MAWHPPVGNPNPKLHIGCAASQGLPFCCKWVHQPFPLFLFQNCGLTTQLGVRMSTSNIPAFQSPVFIVDLAACIGKEDTTTAKYSQFVYLCSKNPATQTKGSVMK